MEALAKRRENKKVAQLLHLDLILELIREKRFMRQVKRNFNITPEYKHPLAGLVLMEHELKAKYHKSQGYRKQVYGCWILGCKMIKYMENRV